MSIMLGITRGTASCAVGSSSGAVQEQKYLLRYTENDQDRNIKLATTWAVTDLGNGDRNHGWSWRCSKVKEQHFFKLCLWNLCSQFKQDSLKQKECHDFCGCLQYQGINSMPFAWWTSNPSLTYVPSPLLLWDSWRDYRIMSPDPATNLILIDLCNTWQSIYSTQSMLNVNLKKLILCFCIPGCIFIFSFMNTCNIPLVFY